MISSFTVNAFCDEEHAWVEGEGDGRRTMAIGVLDDFGRWTELVILPLVMVVQRDEEIRMARFKCERRLPC